MKINRKLSKYLSSRKKDDSYWIEHLKLDFALQLEKRRLNANLSYAELAKKLGTSAAYISKVFRGDANLTIESMVKLARSSRSRVCISLIDEDMAVSPNYLFANTTRTTVASNSIENQLIEKIAA